MSETDPKPRPKRSAAADGAAMAARRPLTSDEVRRRLRVRGHAAEDIEAAIESLEADRFLDDLRLARHYIEVRGNRRGHGPDRLVRELERRGVDPAVTRRALTEVLDDGEFDPAGVLRAAAARRVAALGERRDRKAYARVYNALLRAGHDAEEIRRELEPYQAGDPFNTPHDDET